MDRAALEARKQTLIQNLQNGEQQVSQLTRTMARIEGAIAIIEELLAEEAPLPDNVVELFPKQEA